jgi:hemolysin D
MPELDLAAPNLVPRGRRRRHELAFLPAALEIVATPASPLAHGVMLAICGFLALALVWSILGEVDITAVARGRIVPLARTKVVQPLEPGIVRAIHVEDGMAVRAGQVLIELDRTEQTAALEQALHELATVRARAARLEAQLTGDVAAFVAPVGTPPPLAALERDLLARALAEQAAKLDGIAAELAARKAERGEALAEIAGLERLLPLTRELVEMRRTLGAGQIIARTEVIAVEKERIEREQALAAAKERVKRLDAALLALQKRRGEAEAGFARAALDELAQARARLPVLEQERLRLVERARRQVLTAPIDGTVEGLAVRTVGGVVTEAQPLLVVVPADGRVLVEAVIENKDVGFIRAGQPAEIKVATFPYTKHGLIPGTVESVAADALEAGPKVPDGDRAAGTNEAAAPAEPHYVARIALARASLLVDGREMRLLPGMAVEADIRTGERRLIEHLLSPVLRYRHEALRER